MDRDQIRDNETASCMTISISTGFPDFEQDINIFSVDTDAQKVAAMDRLTDYLDKNCEGWSIGYQHGADRELLCFDEWTYQVGEVDTHFAFPIQNDEDYLALALYPQAQGGDEGCRHSVNEGPHPTTKLASW